MLSKFFGENRDEKKSRQQIFGVVLVFSALALLASLWLSIEKIHLLENPDAKLSCSINVVLNCASVMKTPQSSVFGFPNSFLGLIGYGVLVAFALGGLFRIRYPREAIILIKAGVDFALIFSYWLFFQSVYVIQILCPWCLLVTFSTTMVFAALVRYSLLENTYNLSRSFNKKAETLLRKDYDKLFFAGVIVFMTALVYLKFGDSLFS